MVAIYIYTLKLCFIALLLIIFFLLFGLDSIKKFREKKTIIVEGTRDYVEADQPGITVCASVTGKTGWRDYEIEEKVFETVCGSSTNAEEASVCINKGTFNFSEIILQTTEANKLKLNESHWALDLNLINGKCFTLNASAANIGTDTKQSLAIEYPEKDRVYQYTIVHDPNFLFIGPNPETMPRILTIQNPSHGTKIIYMRTIEHRKLNVPHSPCEDSVSYSLTACMRNTIAKRIGCRPEWDMWSDSERQVCTEMDQLVKLYAEFDGLYNLEKKELARQTGCLLPCSYKEYQIVEAPIDVEPSLRILHLIRPTNTVLVKQEHLWYPFSSFLAEFGGALGLFLGFSFLMVWDWLQLGLTFIIKQNKNTKKTKT